MIIFWAAYEICEWDENSTSTQCLNNLTEYTNKFSVCLRMEMRVKDGHTRKLSKMKGLSQNIIERYLLIILPYYKRCVWVRGGPSRKKKRV